MCFLNEIVEHCQQKGKKKKERRSEARDKEGENSQPDISVWPACSSWCHLIKLQPGQKSKVKSHIPYKLYFINALLQSVFSSRIKLFEMRNLIVYFSLVLKISCCVFFVFFYGVKGQNYCCGASTGSESTPSSRCWLCT